MPKKPKGVDSPTLSRKQKKKAKKGKKVAKEKSSEDEDFYACSPGVTGGRKGTAGEGSPLKIVDDGDAEPGEVKKSRGPPSRKQPPLPPGAEAVSSPSKRDKKLADDGPMDSSDEELGMSESSPFNFDFTKQKENMLAARALLGSKNEEDDDESESEDVEESPAEPVDDGGAMEKELKDELDTFQFGTSTWAPAKTQPLGLLEEYLEGSESVADSEEDDFGPPPLPPPRTAEEGYREITNDDRADVKSALDHLRDDKAELSRSAEAPARSTSVASKWEAAVKRLDDRERSESVCAAPKGFGTVSKVKEKWAAGTVGGSQKPEPPGQAATFSRSTGNVAQRAAIFLSDRGGEGRGRGRGQQRGRGRGGRGRAAIRGGDVGGAKALFENRSAAKSAPAVRREVPVVPATSLTERKEALAGVLGKTSGAASPTSKPSGRALKVSGAPTADAAPRPDANSSKSARGPPKASKLEKLTGERTTRPGVKDSKDYSLEFSVDEDTNQLIVVGGHPPGLLQRCLDDSKKNFDQEVYIQTFLLTHPLFYPSADLVKDLFELWDEEEATVEETKKKKDKDGHKLTKTQIRILTFCHKWVFEFNTVFVMSPELRKQFCEKVESLKERRAAAGGRSKKKAKKYLKEIELFNEMSAKMNELTEVQASGGFCKVG